MLRQASLLLASSYFLSTSSAFVVFEGAGTIHGDHPDISSFELSSGTYLRPLSTRTLHPTDSDYNAIPAATPSSPAPSATTIPSFSSGTPTDDPPLSTAAPVDHQELKKRQNIVGPGNTLGANPDQMPPVTTYQVQSGAAQIQVVYTQLFAEVPDQWESPVAGSIGLGTIKGQVGVVKSKRAAEVDVPATDAPLVLGRGMKFDPRAFLLKNQAPSNDEPKVELDEFGRSTSPQTGDAGGGLVGTLKWSSVAMAVVGAGMFML